MSSLPITEERGYIPHEGQLPLHQQKAKVKVLEVGRRWGKGRFAIGELIDTYYEAQHTPVPPSVVPPFHAWIVVPNYPQGRQTWNELMEFLPSEWLYPGGIHQDEWVIHLKGVPGREWGQLELKSAHDPESLQTVGLDFLWISEAQDITDEAFEKLLPTLRSPGRLGRAVWEGIPSLYADHWFRKAYTDAERGRKNFLAFKATCYDNPLLSEEQITEIDHDRELLREAAWRRMYMAEFSSSAGFFTNIEACITGDILPEPMPGHRYVAGLDLGRKLDPSVLTIWDATERRIVNLRVWDGRQNWVIQREGVKGACEDWALERVVADATGLGDVFIEELVNEGITVDPYIFTSWTREQLLNGFAVSMERETIHFPKIPQLVKELQAFQSRKQPSGSFRIEVPGGTHDDHVFSAALGLSACDPPGYNEHYTGKRIGGRYLPTMAETASGGNMNSYGRQVMQQLQHNRMKDRLERSGFKE